MNRALAWLVLAGVFVLALVAPRLALAQSIEIIARASPQTVEVGDALSYTVQASAAGQTAPEDVQPGNLAGFQIQGTTSGPHQQISMINGVTTVSTGIVATWRLRATKTGTFTLGPASVKAPNGRRQAAAVKVTVVAKGQAPRRPFDPFSGLFDFDDDRPQPQAPPPLPPDPKLALGAPLGQIAFLHAVVDKTRAVVGEQVTLTVYLYEDPYERQAQPRDVHEPAANDFVKKALVEDETHALNLGNAMVGERQWSVKLLRKTALFPLKAGRLTIEPMSMTLPHARVGLRASERIAIDVVEPPAAGRPSGYALGDVGDMSLSATVTPRAIEQDGAVGVTVELRGTGNLPAQLTMPVAPGIEWLDAQSNDKLGAQANEKFGGTRTFSWVARVHKDGAVDLGEVRLPYYDADKRAYGIARASLGIVDVKKGAAKDAGGPEEEPPLTGMPKERRALEGAREETFLADRPAFWGLLFGSPAACALAIGASGLLRRVRARREAASSSPAKLAKDRIAEAEAACAGDDGKKAMGAVARAVEAKVLAATGVNVRGGASATIARDLEEAGVADPEPVLAVLRACEDARFSPDGVDIAAAREEWSRAKAALEKIGGKA